jgi:hypothetical protein
VAAKQADNDLKSVIGFFDASLGQRGPEESGKAILARQKQGETANVNFIDNLGRALWHYGRVCLDLIPHIYDTPRVIHILGADEVRREVGINQQWVARGAERLYDVTSGRYNVTLSVGPTYQSKRQEAVASMLQLVAAAPNMLPIIGDLLVGEMDWPVAKQIAERLKKVLPPPLQEHGEDGQPPLPPQVQAMLQQSQQIIQQQQQALASFQSTIQSKQIEAQSRERVAAISANASMAIAAAKMGAERDLANLEAEVKAGAQKLDLVHDYMMGQMDRQADVAGSSADQSQAAQADVAQQRHDAEQAALDRAHEQAQGVQDRRHQAGLARAQALAQLRTAALSRQPADGGAGNGQ